MGRSTTSSCLPLTSVRRYAIPIYDFVCDDCGEVTEARAGYDAPPIACPACGGEAKRSAVYRVNIACEGLPTQAGIAAHERRHNVSEFQEASADIAHANEKRERQEGHKIDQHSIYKAARRRAKKLMAAGIKDVKDAPYA